MGCFQFFAVMNRLAMNFFIQVFYGHVFSFLFDKYLQVEFLGHVMGYVKIYRNLQTIAKRFAISY